MKNLLDNTDLTSLFSLNTNCNIIQCYLMPDEASIICLPVTGGSLALIPQFSLTIDLLAWNNKQSISQVHFNCSTDAYFQNFKKMRPGGSSPYTSALCWRPGFSLGCHWVRHLVFGTWVGALCPLLFLVQVQCSWSPQSQELDAFQHPHLKTRICDLAIVSVYISIFLHLS